MADKRHHSESDKNKNKKILCFYEARETDIKKNSESSVIKPTALIKKNVFKINNDLTDNMDAFDEPDIKHLDNIVEEAITDCLQCFQRKKYKCGNEVKFVRGEDREEAYIKIRNSYRNLFGPIREQNVFDDKLQEYEQRESGCSFDSILKLTIKYFWHHDRGASSYSTLREAYCYSKFIVNIQNTEDIFGSCAVFQPFYIK